MVDKILSDGLIPIIILGSAQESETEKNPYSWKKRKEIISSIYPNTLITPIDDNPSYDIWLQSVEEAILSLGIKLQDEIAIYTHNKEEDRHDFIFENREYKNEFYSKVYEDSGYIMRHAELSDIPIRSTQIREDLEANKQWLDPRVYNFIKRAP